MATLDIGLHGRTALVSGSTAGIGFAAATALAAQGARTIVNGRTQSRVDAALAKIECVVPRADLAGIAADVSTADGCASVAAHFPAVDILINNMGIFEAKPFEQIDDADWLRFFEANVLSGVRLTRAYLDYMRRQGWGRVIFVSSESGVQIPVEMIHYGITVNSVLPGPTRSEGVATFVKQLAAQGGVSETEMERQFFATARPTSLQRRFTTVEEVANAIVYLSSPAASATTGTAMRVDGGVVRAIP